MSLVSFVAAKNKHQYYLQQKMTIIDILKTIAIPPLTDCGVKLNKMERLKTYFHKLDIADFCTTNEEALILINNVLVEVEDCHSGIAANERPDLAYNGRMYPIQADFIVRDNNKIIAKSKGNEIIIDNNGDFIIKDRKSEIIIISKIR